MKPVKFLLFAAVVVLCAVQGNAQTVDDIISRHVDAVGGKEKLSQIKSVSMEGTMEAGGNDATFSETILNGKGMKMTMDFNGTKMMQCYTDTGGWSINPRNGDKAAPLDAEQYKSARYQIYIPDLLFNYGANGNKAALIGKEDSSYKIEMTTPDSIVSTYYIDTASYYINKIIGKTTFQGQEIQVTNHFSNYQKTDAGVILPFTIGTDFGDNFSFSRIISKVEINKETDPKIFAMPTQ